MRQNRAALFQYFNFYLAYNVTFLDVYIFKSQSKMYSARLQIVFDFNLLLLFYSVAVNITDK